LVEVATDAQRALRAVEHDDELLSDAAVGEAARLLAEIVGQEFDTAEDDDDRPRPRHRRSTRQIISAHDPENAHGRKTNAAPIYRLQAACRDRDASADSDRDLCLARATSTTATTPPS
jgi:hypothetical protein